MKGIILAGGYGTRLYPITLAVNKHLIPVFDKPMIYYPIATLMWADIRDILFITNPEDLTLYQQLLQDGAQWGMNFSYYAQPKDQGLGHAFLIANSFINHQPVCLALGDNIFHSGSIETQLKAIHSDMDDTLLFSVWRDDPRPYGTVTLNHAHQIVSIEPNATQAQRSHVVTGLYRYPNDVVDIAKSLKTEHDQLGIFTIHETYLQQGRLKSVSFHSDTIWFDAGTHRTLLQASCAMADIERQEHKKVACLEEIAWQKGYINDEALERLADNQQHSSYGIYLRQLLE